MVGRGLFLSMTIDDWRLTIDDGLEECEQAVEMLETGTIDILWTAKNLGLNY